MSWILACLLLATASRAAEQKQAAFSNDAEAQWVPLVQAHDLAKAKTLCEGWAAAKDEVHQAESHKCLADLSMNDGKVDEALKHLDAAIKLLPADVSARDSQLQVLMWARRFDQMPAAVEAALKACDDSGLDVWLDYSARFLDDERYAEGLAYTRALEKRFPKDFRVEADMGALLAASKKFDEALPYLKRAVALKPDDALDNWNLGKLYDEMGKADLADKQLKKALSLEKEPNHKKEYECLYAEFLKRRKRPGAAAYEKQHCPEGVPEEE